MVLGVLLALAELVSWWGVLVLPFTVALMVKFNDVVAGASTAHPVARESASPGASMLRPASMAASSSAAHPAVPFDASASTALTASTASTVSTAAPVTAGDSPMVRPVGGSPMVHPVSGAMAAHPVSGAMTMHPVSGAMAAHPASGSPMGWSSGSSGDTNLWFGDEDQPGRGASHVAPLSASPSERRGNSYSFSTPGSSGSFTAPGTSSESGSFTAPGSFSEPGAFTAPGFRAPDESLRSGSAFSADDAGFSAFPADDTGRFEPYVSAAESGRHDAPAVPGDFGYRRPTEFGRHGGFAPIVSRDPSAVGYGPAVSPQFLVDGHQHDGLTEMPTVGYPGSSATGTPRGNHPLPGHDHPLPGHDHPLPGHDHPLHPLPGHDHPLPDHDHPHSGNDYSLSGTDHPLSGTDHPPLGHDYPLPAQGHSSSAHGRLEPASGQALPASDHPLPVSDHPYGSAAGQSYAAGGNNYSAAGGQSYPVTSGNPHTTASRHPYENQGQVGAPMVGVNEDFRPSVSNATTRRPWTEQLDVRQQMARQAAARRYE
ncbi:hypothetical protein J3R03_007254 [Actinoplanes couchii]|nr:hypothetical protein [Actinoplanes couchii]